MPATSGPWGEIRTIAGVEKILVSLGPATWVRLGNGEEIPIGRLVASGVEPRQSALRFFDKDAVGSENSAR